MIKADAFSRREYLGKISWVAPKSVSALKGCHFRVRRKFQTAKMIDPALYISAESWYVLYINGHQVGTGPARGTCGCNFVDEYGLGECLDDDEIFIGIEVFCNNFPTFTAAPAGPSLFICVGDEVCDESWQVQIAEDWRTDVPNYTFQIGLTEWRDYRKMPNRWQVFEDNSKWQSAEIIDICQPIYAKRLFYRDVARLIESKILPVRISSVYSVESVAELAPCAVAEVMTCEEHLPLELDLTGLCEGKKVIIPPQPDRRGVVVIADPQQAYIGGFELDIEAPAGTIIDVGNDEDFVDGRLGFKRCEDYRQADRYVHAGGRHVVSNPLHYRGGRYLQFVFRNFGDPLILHRLEFVDRRYPVGQMAEFECDNAVYNEIWKRCVHSMRTCATDAFIDCPWREQAFWVNDFLVQSIYWFELTGNSELVRRSLDLAMSQRTDDGFVPGVCPFDGRRWHVLFATNLFLPIILRNYLLYTGDREYVATVMPTVIDIFNCCQKYADDEGLLSPDKEFWNFVDWGYLLQDPTLEAYPLNGRNTCVVNWFNVLACNALAELSTDEAVAIQYNMRARSIAAAIEKRFWSDVDGMFYEWCGGVEEKNMYAGTLTHSLAILSSRLSEEKHTCVKAALKSDKLYHPELYMLHYVMETLADMGEHGKIESIIGKYWESMLAKDTPTIWENNVYRHGKEALWGLGSLCHAFALSPVNYFQKYILGIRPLADGFKRFSFSPNPAGREKASGSIPTPHGWIKVHWKIVDDNIIANLSVPIGTLSILPDGVELGPGMHEVVIA